MAALVAAIHNRDFDRLVRTEIMDGRDKPGHDEFLESFFLCVSAALRESLSFFLSRGGGFRAKP